MRARSTLAPPHSILWQYASFLCALHAYGTLYRSVHHIPSKPTNYGTLYCSLHHIYAKQAYRLRNTIRSLHQIPRNATERVLYSLWINPLRCCDAEVPLCIDHSHINHSPRNGGVSYLYRGPSAHIQVRSIATQATWRPAGLLTYSIT